MVQLRGLASPAGFGAGEAACGQLRFPSQRRASLIVSLIAGFVLDATRSLANYCSTDNFLSFRLYIK